MTIKHSNKQSNRNLVLAAKNSKIAEGMKKYHERKKQELEEAKRIEEQLSQNFISLSSTRDALRYSFTNLTPATIRGILDSTRGGYLMNWSDFCDYMVEMDPHIRGLVNVRTHSVSGKKPIIEPSDNSEEAKLAASFAREIVNNIPEFDKLTRQLLMATFKGVSTAEIIYKRNEQKNYFEIEEIIPVSMRRIKIRLNPVDKDGDNFITNSTNGYGKWIYSYWNYGDNAYGEGLDVQDMFPGKFIIHSPGDEEIPHYRGLFRSLAFTWFFKQAGTAFWASGAEKYAFPVTYGKVPRATPENARLNLVQNLNNLANDAAAVFDEDVLIDTINPGATGGDSVWKQFIGYLNAEMTKLLLGGTLAVEASSTGANRALGEVHERVREDLMLADANALSETLKHQLIKPLLEYNLHLFGGKMPPLPNVSFDVITRTYEPISNLHVDCGVVTVNELRESAGLIPWSKEQGGESIAKVASVEDPIAGLFNKPSKSVSMDITNIGAFEDAGTAYADKNKIELANKKKKKDELTDQEIAEEMTDYVSPLPLSENIDVDLVLYIEKEGSSWIVRSEAGEELGSFETKEEAIERLKEIEFFKQNKG